jgi:D-apiose dehydrogenase
MTRRSGSTFQHHPCAVAGTRAHPGAGRPVKLAGDFMAHGHRPEQRDDLEVLGTNGAILLHDERLAATGASTEALTLDLAASYAASYHGAIAHFVDCVIDGAPFETEAAGNVETLKLVEEAYRAGA